MYLAAFGAAAITMICGPLVLHWIRANRLKRHLSRIHCSSLHSLNFEEGRSENGSFESIKRSASLLHFFGWLDSVAPKFAVNGSNIRVLLEPREFYSSLKRLSGQAKKRIVLTSLYIGTGDLEQSLVETILKQLKSEQSDGNQLKVQILLDYSRGSRGKNSSISLLLPLIKQFSSNVQVALFHSPDLRGLTKLVLPERMNEVVGLQHMKIYIFDNTFIISGANLSDSYFENRQDRYILFEDCEEVADFLAALVDVVSSFSFHLEPNGEASFPSFLKHPYDSWDGGDGFREEARTALEALLHSRTKNLCQHSASVQIQSSPLLEAYLKNHDKLDTKKEQKHKEADTWLYPLVQMGPIGINVDSSTTKVLMESAPKSAKIFLASGYFNLTKSYMDVILNKSFADFEILMASPSVNGFYGAHGLSGNIPAVYTQVAKDFYNKVNYLEQQARVRLYEFYRDKWTFHAKGLWYHLPGQSLPSLTLIGSPNFGYRSECRDLEMQLALVTKNDDLRQQLHKERVELYKRSSCVEKSVFNNEEHSVPKWVSFLTNWIKDYF